MKFTKLSLVAALLAGSAAFAVDNVKVSGDANLFYMTSNQGDADLFDKDSSAADASLNLNITADLAKNDMVTLSAGAGYTILTTLGLENNLVSNVWGGAHTATAGTGNNFASGLGGAKVENASWMNELWIAATAGKTTLKLGRMELDTPLAFTEKWSIEKNTFEGIAVINQDIPDTTLVGAWVANGNGTETFGTGSNTVDVVPGAAVPTNNNMQSNVVTLGHAAGAVVNANGDFATYGSDGAYAAGIINNSFKPLTVQAWYYNVSQIATAYWLQADLACQKIPGLLAGVQYTGLDIDSTSDKIHNDGSTAAAKVDSDALAVMLGYEMKDMATIKVSYSQIGKDHSAGQNTATDFVGGTAQSKLYTEAWWNYGYITQQDTDSYNVTIESPVNGLFDLGIYYTEADQSTAAGDNDLSEVTVTAAKSYGPADITVAYINAKTGNLKRHSVAQAYLTLNF
ncbi:hypothetical protein [Sulfurimonas microaerophilic]|uniref:hypothetical protein n=1 Tax=Sulfurimonas microaerophilic TaxID=3058392 RepID=UPI0027148E1C|nr:hypothetical protein [Sulfurimonas sp. hsl 1-7]